MSSSSNFFQRTAVPSSSPVLPYSDSPSQSGHLPVRDLVNDSQSDAVAQHASSDALALQAVVQALIDPRNAHFTTDNPSSFTRYVKIDFSNPQALRARRVEALSNAIQNTPFQACASYQQVTNDVLVFEFDSFSDAQAAVDAKDQLEGFGPVAASFVTIEEFTALCDGFHQTRFITANATLEEACLSVMSWMDEHLGSGDLLSVVLINVVRDYNSHTFQFRLELDSREQAEVEVRRQRFDGRIKDSRLSSKVIPYTPAGYAPVVRANSPYPVDVSLAIQTGGAVQPVYHPRRNSSGLRSTTVATGRRDDQSNTIDLDRIKRGQDVRTTVMLRNIPNQMTTYDLERLLKGWAFGQFDFLYLRIDFANMCNVGYAFVNFDSPMTIVKVKQQLDTDGWPGHLGSNKRAAMSYATVQGVESLIEKFRNSSVMLEAPQCRPRLFWTLHDVCSDPLKWHLQSQEKPFPGPNNEAKLARSRQNAETQGLYPAHSREEHRRGFFHSNFDRGNPNGTPSGTPNGTPNGFLGSRIPYY
ncbi:putative meiosis protein mei2 protein [Botryosphaeria dothidea]|uniref:Meiosis protein mei2 protein n=1 Tax=Botryosphaeria dothidea TaxID=55169 RepID=A0A8H4ILX3_9PEZI|nr:putative meiosis protein mei2 protein [Botryosphaeria dothidea]